MRRKLYRCLSLLYKKETVSREVELDAAYFKINLKGTKSKNMPRYSKSRGNTSAYFGVSHHKICTIVAVDEKDNIFLKISSLGSESLEKYELQQEHFKDVKTVISDSKACIQHFANILGSKHEVIPVVVNKKRYTTVNGKHFGDVNELIEGFRHLLNVNVELGRDIYKMNWTFTQ